MRTAFACFVAVQTDRESVLSITGDGGRLGREERLRVGREGDGEARV